MDYDGVSALAKTLGYRDKLRLAQLLIQLARREEEQEHPEKRGAESAMASSEWNPGFVAERIRKLRPRSRTALLNSIDAMYQFHGGISAEDKERLVKELDRDHGIAISQNNRVSYSD
ncbi:MAG: hypothetical protein OXJ53_01105 [Gammaproteobacteria bacterium]|nr:hypothetical protein [Gammaproteobacteria bacterium]MDE0273674.1 hypothetical protein [Gammaproteobacteria bacterium]